MYYFVRLYEYYDIEQDKSATEENKINLYFGNKILIDEDVFIAENREEAKKHCKETYGDFPFALSKKNKINGNRYFYLCDSSLYWYNYHNEEIEINCDYCKEKKIVKGRKREIYNRFGTYCSYECRDKHYDELVNTIENEYLWISDTEHLGIPKDNDMYLVGYIYKITNKHTLKCYVGKTIKAPLFRWWQHLKVDNKFERANISDLVFEVLEIVTYNSDIEKEKYKSGSEKLSDREAYYIHRYDCIENGYNLKNEIEIEIEEREDKEEL